MIYSAYAIPGLRKSKNLDGEFKLSQKMQTDRIIDICCNHFGISFEQLVKKNRKKEYVSCRRFIIYFLRMNTSLTTTKIAAMLHPSVSDHTTIVHHMKQTHDYIATKEHGFMYDFNTLNKQI
jgi:chromosomal replication initiation ATPase DnaA